MNIIKINSAESIIEAFYDGGESYEGHEKYSPLSAYTVTVPDSVKAAVKQGWCAADILIYSGKEAVSLERECDLDVSGFDRITISAMSRNVNVSVTLTTDKGEQPVLKDYPVDRKEFGGAFAGSRLLKIRIDVSLTNPENSGDLNLHWLALANSAALPQTLIKGYHFSPEWTACFKDDYKIGPEMGIYFGEDEIEQLRQKLSKPPFDKIYARMKEAAYSCVGIEPEEYIGEYLTNENKMWCRPGDIRKGLIEYLPNLCVVAVVEQDRQLVRLAGRMLLSIAVTPHWCESIMGNLPGATWHHRSFLEGLVCKRCAIALDLIGSSLTWHGKNLVYDAMIQKGLPRVEADMFTMEYVRHCNQGVVFNNERIFAYIALAHRYPRYAKMLEIAEADFNDMLEKNIEEDGGSLEGPSYWSYTIDNVAEAAIVLARYRQKPLMDYASPRLKKIVDYVLAVLCHRPEGCRYMLLNDTYGYGSFSSYTLDFLYRISGNDFIGSLVAKSLQEGGCLESVLLIEKSPALQQMPLPNGLVSLNSSGFTTLRSQTASGKHIQVSLRSGKAYFSHFHEDKGELLLFADDEELLCDRGNCSAIGKKPISHNLFVPENEALPYSQLADDCDGRILEAKYENDVFTYRTDLTNAWESGIFENLTREVFSQKAGEYIVTDRASCVRNTAMSLRFHSIYPIEKQGDSFVVKAVQSRLTITPMDYAASRYEIRQDGETVVGEPLYQLVIHFASDKVHNAATKLVIE